MTPTFSSPQVVCRPALERDHTDIAEFCKGIWEGGDYVPEVWRHWFNDPNGILVTAEYNGHAIGCAKLSLISEGQWWLEGFRVDPNYQGLKIGSRLHHYVTDWWAENGNGVVRLMTSSENLAVHHLCDKTGYAKTYEVCGYQATPIEEPTDNFSPIADMREAASFAIESESIKATDGLMDLGWRIAAFDENIFEKYSSYQVDFVHTFYWWRDKQGLFSAWNDEDDEKRTLVMGVLACALNDMSALLMDIRRLAARKKFTEVFQIAFDIPQIVARLESAGFAKHWEHNAFVFEKGKPER